MMNDPQYYLTNMRYTALYRENPFPGSPSEANFLRRNHELSALDDCEVVQHADRFINMTTTLAYTLRLRDFRALDGATYLSIDAIKCALGRIAENQTDEKKGRFMMHLLPKFEEGNLDEQMRRHVTDLRKDPRVANIFRKDWLVVAYFHGNIARVTVVKNPNGLLFIKPPKGSKRHGVSQGKAEIWHFLTNGKSSLQERVKKQIYRFLRLFADVYERQMYFAVTKTNSVEHLLPLYTKERERPYEALNVIHQVFSSNGTLGEGDPDMEMVCEDYVSLNRAHSPYFKFRAMLCNELTDFAFDNPTPRGITYLRVRFELLRKYFKVVTYVSPFHPLEGYSDLEDDSDESESTGDAETMMIENEKDPEVPEVPDESDSSTSLSKCWDCFFSVFECCFKRFR